MTGKQQNRIVSRIKHGQRLSFDDGLALYECPDLNRLATLATCVRRRHNGNAVYYNRNFHIEPTNVCVNDCVFCSYRRRAGEDGSWALSLDDVRELCRRYVGAPVTEVHIVGGVHPGRDIYFYAALLDVVRQTLPQVAIKAFTAVEIDYMAKHAGMSYEKALRLLQENGLAAMPGGGAEIFDETVRRQICPRKTDAQTWLYIHETAHDLGIRTNATMLFGHIETPAHRIDHLIRLRELQDTTGGFDAFIPLKYKASNNALGAVVGEISTSDVLRTIAVCRMMLDNIAHIKAYWPMLGKDVMQLALLFGADDIYGTIDDSTRIYSMAGADEHPSLCVPELENIITDAGFVPTERDTFYNTVTK
ncbi:MAG: aminofutalosine synthase MqnE [Prevotellaceae bacterium]|nr:aminofutalosine synthase MqnE [Prevotellaceae bacterium]